MKITAQQEKNIIALLIVLVAFGIFMIFYNNQSFLQDSGDVPKYIAMGALALGILMVLFYMVSARADKHTKKSSSKKKK